MRGCCDLLCLLLDRHVGRHPCLTYSLFHPFLTLYELRDSLILVVHLSQDCSELLVLLLLPSLVLLFLQV